MNSLKDVTLIPCPMGKLAFTGAMTELVGNNENGAKDSNTEYLTIFSDIIRRKREKEVFSFHSS